MEERINNDLCKNAMDIHREENVNDLHPEVEHNSDDQFEQDNTLEQNNDWPNTEDLEQGSEYITPPNFRE